MKMNLRIKYADGSAAEAKISAADLVAFEAQFNKSVAKFQEQFMLTDVYWLAWHSVKRRDKNVGTFEEWLDATDPTVEFGEDEQIVPLESSQ